MRLLAVILLASLACGCIGEARKETTTTTVREEVLQELVSCYETQNQKVMDWCFYSASKALNDSTLCNRIQRQDLKADCHREAGSRENSI